MPVALVAILSVSSSSAQQNLTLRTVLDRLARYLSDYADRLPATIATEHYEQRYVRPGSSRAERVTLESEFGIMRLDDTGGWLGLRDVLTVNGKALDGRQQRLRDLFASPSKQGIQQARRIARENARFNLGPIQRTINDPAVVLELLDGRNASRMRFTKTDETSVNGLATWAIRFDEQRRPTIIQTAGGRDQPVKGTAWVEPGTGRLVRAEVKVESQTDRVGYLTRNGFTATIDVTFRDEPRLRFWVPSEMNERYQDRTGTSCSGNATYSDYRTFGVETKVISP